MMNLNMKEETQRLKNKFSNFKDSVKIHLKHLQFEESKNRSLSLHLNSRNVARLIKVFELESCLRLKKEHRISAIINETALQKALSTSTLTNANLLISQVSLKLQLSQSTRLNCLHEKHRIVAAQEILLLDNKWWTIDLYTEGFSSQLCWCNRCWLLCV